MTPLVVAANRLPVMRTDDGWSPSPGGLVRALWPMLRDTGGTWVGWAGDADASSDTAPPPFTVDGVELQPVPITAEELELYYEGFSNDGLWPLYHDALRESTYSVEQWDAYVAVNERFAAAIACTAPADAVVWVHDYQLQLVPAMLRAQRADVTIGFFLHIPFPPYELFSRLPWRTEIVEGLLGCDLIGFQSPKATVNFVGAVRELHPSGVGDDAADAMAVDVTAIDDDGRTVHVGSFPISIDVEEVEATAAGRATRQRASRIRARLGDPEVVLLGVDRLDYTKGIGSRLQAYGALLASGALDPEQHVLVQVATPTREAVEHYQDERAEVERLVGEINGLYSRIGLPAVHYLYQTLGFDELIALYRAADVMLVTPFRDGMNLVAKEYAAAHIDGDGVLVLSEFAGAAHELTEAVLVNPHDEIALQQAIMTAVDMHRHERRQRMHALREQIRANDVQSWAHRFLDRLTTGPAALPADIARRPRPLLVGLDVDGVLSPIVDHPDDALLLDGIADAVGDVAALDDVHVAVVSGRALADLARFSLPAGVEVIGSHGLEANGATSPSADDGERTLLATADDLATTAAARAGDGAFVERKPLSVVLHVRRADPERGAEAVTWLTAAATAHGGLLVKPGSGVLEVLVRDGDKGAALSAVRDRIGAATVVYVGDDVTDEDVFATLRPGDLGVKVGPGPTAATARLPDPRAVRALLRALAGAPHVS